MTNFDQPSDLTEDIRFLREIGCLGEVNGINSIKRVSEAIIGQTRKNQVSVKLANTITDLAASEPIETQRLADTLQYRTKINVT